MENTKAVLKKLKNLGHYEASKVLSKVSDMIKTITVYKLRGHKDLRDEDILRKLKYIPE
jgi:hypothetical protein